MPKRKGFLDLGHGDTEEARKWEPREMRMVTDYLAQFFPTAYTITRVKLGSLPQSELYPLLEDHEVAALSVFQRWADAIAITSDTIYLIEGAIRPSPGDISQIQAYRRLLEHTPELKTYFPRKVVMQLVYAVEDPLVVMMAREAGIIPVYFRPSYIESYIKTLFPRQQRAPKYGE